MADSLVACLQHQHCEACIADTANNCSWCVDSAHKECFPGARGPTFSCDTTASGSSKASCPVFEFGPLFILSMLSILALFILVLIALALFFVFRRKITIKKFTESNPAKSESRSRYVKTKQRPSEANWLLGNNNTSSSSFSLNEDADFSVN